MIFCIYHVLFIDYYVTIGNILIMIFYFSGAHYVYNNMI